MVVYPLVQQLSSFVDFTTWADLTQPSLIWQSIDWSLLAQFETDVFRPVREFFNNFIQSGQIWAFLIGIVLGYLLRSLTSYG
jgi:hypothetical protein